jgi:hypothetical protein
MCPIMVFGIADMNFVLGDMNRCCLCAPLAPVIVGVGKSNTDNSVKTIVFGNTQISHTFNHTVPEQSVAGIYI